MNRENADIRYSELAKFGAETGVSRRDFMKRAVVLGVSAAAASSIWSDTVMAAKSGGHVSVGSNGGASVDTFHPWKAIGTDHVTNATLATYDTLTESGHDGSAKPSLAESWDVSADGRTWAFKLRKGVEFHNGKSLTADDVVYSLGLHTSEDTSFAEGKTIIENLEVLKADGPDTVVMVQKEVNFDLPVHLTSFGFIIGPEGTENWDAGIGTGPYKLEYFEPGVTYRGTKAPNFYRDDQGFFDSVEILNIADPATRTNALRTGSVDVIGDPDADTAKMLDKLDGFSVLEVPGTQHYTTAMRTDMDPLSNNHLRNAIKYGIKREEILNKVFGGFGYVGNDIPIGKGQQFYNDTLPQREYDLDKAKWHMQQAGLSAVSLELAASEGAFGGSVDAAVLMKESMKHAGIDVTVKRAPADGYWSDVWLTHPWCFVYWNGRPTVDWMLSSSYISTSSWNDTYFKNARFDSLLTQARAESDQEKRKAMYFEAQEILYNEGGTTVFAFASYLHGTTDKLGHGPVGTSRRMDDNRLVRRWWWKG